MEKKPRNKILIVDDEIAKNQTTKVSLLKDIDLAPENSIFAGNYEQALNILQTREDLALCLLDYRIPKNFLEYDSTQSSSDRDFVEWGVRLIPEIKIEIIVYSAIVDIEELKKLTVKYKNIIAYSKKGDSSEFFTSETTLFIQKLLLEKSYNLGLKNRNNSELNKDKNPKEEISFDYSRLDRETYDFVISKTKEIERLAKRTVEDHITIGVYLTEVKSKLGHGNFLEWVELEFGFSRSHVAGLMRIAAKFRCTNFANLNILPTALFELSYNNVPDEAIKEALERAEKGERITHTTAKDIKNSYREKSQANKKSHSSSVKNLPERERLNKNGTQIEKNELSLPQNKIARDEKLNLEGPPPLFILNDEQKALLNKSASSQPEVRSKLEILNVNRNVTKDSFWQLGKHHRLFCGEPKNKLFLKQIPKEIALTIGLPPNNNLSLVPSIEAKAKFMFSYSYEDMDLETIKEMTQSAIAGSTSAEDNIVFSYILEPILLRLAEKLGCNCYIGEPDLNKCEEIIELWKEKVSVTRLKIG